MNVDFNIYYVDYVCHHFCFLVLQFPNDYNNDQRNRHTLQHGTNLLVISYNSVHVYHLTDVNVVHNMNTNTNNKSHHISKFRATVKNVPITNTKDSPDN